MNLNDRFTWNITPHQPATVRETGETRFVWTYDTDPYTPYTALNTATQATTLLP